MSKHLFTVTVTDEGIKELVVRTLLGVWFLAIGAAVAGGTCAILGLPDAPGPITAAVIVGWLTHTAYSVLMHFIYGGRGDTHGEGPLDRSPEDMDEYLHGNGR